MGRWQRKGDWKSKVIWATRLDNIQSYVRHCLKPSSSSPEWKRRGKRRKEKVYLCKLEASLGCTERPCLKKTNQPNNQTNQLKSKLRWVIFKVFSGGWVTATSALPSCSCPCPDPAASPQTKALCWLLTKRYCPSNNHITTQNLWLWRHKGVFLPLMPLFVPQLILALSVGSRLDHWGWTQLPPGIRAAGLLVCVWQECSENWITQCIKSPPAGPERLPRFTDWLLKLIKGYFSYLCACRYACMSLCVCRHPPRPEHIGTGVTGGCETPDVCSGNQTLVLSGRAVSAFNPWAIFPARFLKFLLHHFREWKR